MVVCTFLESYDLSKHVIIPFFTYGATTYLNESMQKIYKCTPNSVHIPATLPEDLDPDDITRPGRPDDAGIDMPGNARGVEEWLKRLGLLGNSGIADATADSAENIRIFSLGKEVRLKLDESMFPNTVEIYSLGGTLLHRASGNTSYSFAMPERSIYLLTMMYGVGNKRINRKVML